MLKQETKSTGIKKYTGQATHDPTTCQCDFTTPIDLDSLTSLLIGEREFYYYLTKYDIFLKTILSVIWTDQQEQGNNIKVKVIGKNGNQTYIDYDAKIIQKAEKRQTFEEFWKIFQSDLAQIEFSNTDTPVEETRIQKIIVRNSYQHVKRRYKKLLLKYHPDKNKSNNARKKTLEIIGCYKLIQNNNHLPLEFVMAELLPTIWNYEQIVNPESLLKASLEHEVKE